MVSQEEIERYKQLELFTKCATLQLFATDNVKDNILAEPKSIFSGCFYKEYVLSVYHGIEQHSIISVFVSSEEKKVKHAILHPFYLREGVISEDAIINDLGYIDFFLSKYDQTEQFLCEIYDDDDDVLEKYKRHVFEEILEEPNIVEPYFFGGNIHNNKDDNSKRIFSDFQMCTCEFCGDAPSNEYKHGTFYYRFELPSIILSEDDFIGCSGAPIFNSEGQLVSILCGGKAGTPYIYGLNLSKLKGLIENSSLWK